MRNRHFKLLHPEHRHGGWGRGPGGGRGHHGGGHRRGRMFDYGQMRLVLLSLIAEQPRHGYELIKLLEERLGGAYSPSPGVIYPTLAWLDDGCFAAVEAEQGGRKLYRITPEGEAFLAANKTAVDETLAKTHGHGAPADMPSPIIRAMENLKVALRLRYRQGAIDADAAARIAAAIDAAAQEVEKST